MAGQSSDVDRLRASDTDGDHDAEYRDKVKGSKPLKGVVKLPSSYLDYIEVVCIAAAKDLSHVPCKVSFSLPILTVLTPYEYDIRS